MGLSCALTDGWISTCPFGKSPVVDRNVFAAEDANTMV